MIVCPSCEHENEVGTAFCIACGHDFTLKSNETPTDGSETGDAVSAGHGESHDENNAGESEALEGSQSAEASGTPERDSTEATETVKVIVAASHDVASTVRSPVLNVAPATTAAPLAGSVRLTSPATALTVYVRSEESTSVAPRMLSVAVTSTSTSTVRVSAAGASLVASIAIETMPSSDERSMLPGPAAWCKARK